MTFLLVFSLSCSKETKKENKENKEIEKMIANEDSSLSKTLYPPVIQDKPKNAEYEPVTDDISPLKNKTVSLTLRNSPLRDAVYVLADIGNLNVSIEKGVDPKTPVTMVLSDVTLENALEMVFSSVDYFYTIEDNILKVKAMDTRIYELAVPTIIQNYNVSVGGDILGGAKVASSNMQGSITMSGKTDMTTSKLWESIGNGIKQLLTIKAPKEDKSKAQAEMPVAPAGANPLMQGLMGNQAPPQVQAPPAVQTPQKTEEKEDKAPEPSYSINSHTGVIVVTASKKDLEKVERYLNSIKSSLGRQVLIEAKIVEVELSEGLSYGVNWSHLVTGTALKSYITGDNKSLSSTLGSGLNSTTQNQKSTTSSTNSSTNSSTTSSTASSVDSALIANTIASGLTLNLSARFETVLDLLQTQGNVKTLSNPRISLLNGQTALISVGTTENYISKIEIKEDSETKTITRTPTSETILSGMMLGIAPYIDQENNIILTITPVLSERLSFSEQVFDQMTLKLPTIALREMSTTVKLKDRQMVIIGGLISTKEVKVETGIPILSSIPLLGNLFKSTKIEKQRRELVILIRPVLIQ
jgi:MSHA type pilus biogenesis protein MshL